MPGRYTLLIFLLSLIYHPATAQDAVATRVLKDGLFIPWEIVYGPDDYLWFTQKNGYICRMDTAGLKTDTLLHIPETAVVRESGLLGMAIHPDFDYQPYVYVAYTYFHLPDSAITERIVRYSYNHDANILYQPKTLLDNIRGSKYHNGCRIVISGEYLFITIADATDTTTPQNTSSIQGKVLRIHLDGSTPADNPIPNSPIWSSGHRNVQGLVMANGILYSSEHGPNTDDEVNIIEKGANYGWPFVRGYCDSVSEMAFCQSNKLTPPLHAWTPTIAPCGIDYYNHSMFPSLRKSLLMTTLKDKHLYRLKLNDSGNHITGVDVMDDIAYGRLRDICISPEGRIYLTTSNSEADGKGPFIDKIIEVTNPTWNHTPNTLIIYPDPANYEIYVSPSRRYTSLQYRINDMTGRVAMRGTITPATSNINISLLPEGVYTIALFDAIAVEWIASGKFVRMR